MSKVPASAGEWDKAAMKYGSPIQAIQQFGALNSGSKIEEEQFLALRVIWKVHITDEFDPEKWGLYTAKSDQAHAFLDRVEGWKEYCNGITDKSVLQPQFGRFDLVWDFQKQVEVLFPPTAVPGKLVGPAGGTRSNTRLQEPTTPTRSSQPSKYTYDLDEDFDDAEEIKPPVTPLSKLALDPASPAKAEEKAQFPPADDEQTVNTALILLLRALCLTYKKLRDVPWALERKSFILGSPKLYEARTDGHLRFKVNESKTQSLAILEVKAGIRASLNPRMQESAQMAAWI